MKPDGHRSKLIILPGQMDPPGRVVLPNGTDEAPNELLIEPDRPKLILPGDEGFFIPEDAAILDRRPGAFLDDALKNEPPPNPDRLTKVKLEKAIESATTLEAKTNKGTAYAVRAPKSFQIDQAAALRIVRMPASMSLEDGLKVAPKNDDDGLTVYVSASEERPWSAVRNEVLGAIDHELDYDPENYRVADLAADGTLNAATETWLPAPFVLRNGKWKRISPQADHKTEVPVSEATGKASVIPKELRSQPAEHGALFATCIEDKSAFSNKRKMGVYFPPGYDEGRAEPYPVLVMLPGSGSKLEHWTSYGRCIDQLDELMKSGEKMIVVLPEATGMSAADALKKSVLPHVMQNYHTDESRISIGGISMGGDATMSIACDDITKFKSVSLHSAAISAERDVERFVDVVHSAEAAPRVWIDIGHHDKYDSFIEGSSRLSAQLDEIGYGHDFSVIDDHPTGAKHNWLFWGSQLSKWVAFHQASYGTAGPCLDDCGAEVGTAHKAAAIERDQKVWDELADAIEELPKLTSEATRIATRAADYSGPTVEAAAAKILKIVERAATLLEDTKTLVGTRDPENPRVIPADGRAILSDMKRSIGEVERLEKKLDDLDSFAEENRKHILSFAADFPEVHDAIARLATADWETVWHPDGLTNDGLVESIGAELGSGMFKRPKRAAGIKAYVDAIRSKKKSFKSKPIAKLVNEHPTLVFLLMQAARRDRPIALGSGSYFSDPPKVAAPQGIGAAFDGDPKDTVGRIERALKTFLLAVDAESKKNRPDEQKKRSESKRLEAGAERVTSGVQIAEKKTVADARLSW